MRRLVSDKREAKRQLREAFAKDVDLQRVVTDLDKQYAERNAWSIRVYVYGRANKRIYV